MVCSSEFRSVTKLMGAILSGRSRDPLPLRGSHRDAKEGVREVSVWRASGSLSPDPQWRPWQPPQHEGQEEPTFPGAPLPPAPRMRICLGHCFSCMMWSEVMMRLPSTGNRGSSLGRPRPVLAGGRPHNDRAMAMAWRTCNIWYARAHHRTILYPPLPRPCGYAGSIHNTQRKERGHTSVDCQWRSESRRPRYAGHALPHLQLRQRGVVPAMNFLGGQWEAYTSRFQNSRCIS
jgi:hypothetical protein